MRVQKSTQLATRFGAMRTVMAHRSRHPDEHLFFSSINRRFSMRVLSGLPFRPFGDAEDELQPVDAAVEGSCPEVRILEFCFGG